MDSIFGTRHGDRRQVSFPFLKSLHKVHKMSEEEVRNKDLSSIKFRPVVDAKHWLTKGYSTVVMQMMRELSNTLLEKSGPIFQKLRTKND